MAKKPTSIGLDIPLEYAEEVRDMLAQRAAEKKLATELFEDQIPWDKMPRYVFGPDTPGRDLGTFVDVRSPFDEIRGTIVAKLPAGFYAVRIAEQVYAVAEPSTAWVPMDYAKFAKKTDPKE